MVSPDKMGTLALHAEEKVNVVIPDKKNVGDSVEKWSRRWTSISSFNMEGITCYRLMEEQTQVQKITWKYK